MNNWESNNKLGLFELMVGDFYGSDPHTKKEEIKRSKSLRAKHILGELDADINSLVLEIGSGAGFTSYHIASAVKELYCCDISDSFLELAKCECSNLRNISFHKLEKPLELLFPKMKFDCIFADAVFIHLNIYDIFWYISEFRNVINEKGILWFNIMGSNIMGSSTYHLNKLEEMANYYRQDKSSLENLLSWNSEEMVIEIAKKFNFELIKRSGYHNIDLKFQAK